jgi:hypothetical protein
MADLSRLTLTGYRGDPECVESLLVSPHLPRLAYLDLSKHDLATLRPEVLAAAPHGTALRQLFLHFGALDAAGAQALAGCPAWPACVS